MGEIEKRQTDRERQRLAERDKRQRGGKEIEREKRQRERHG